MDVAMRTRGISYHRMWSSREMRELLARAGFRVDDEARGRSGPWWRLLRIEACPV
jgi:hypothetical protein